MAAKDLVMEQYPFLAFLLNDREIGPLLSEAVDPNKGFSPQTFQNKLMATNWWRNHSEESRRLEIQKHTDPASFKADMQGYRSTLQARAQALGVGLNSAQLHFFSTIGAQGGHDPGGQYMTDLLINSLKKGTKAGEGLRHTSAKAVQQMSKGEFMSLMSNKEADRWGDAIARGAKTMDDARIAMTARAARLYPHFAEGLRNGESIASLTDGYREIIATELELDPDTIDFSRGQWAKVLGWKDGKNGPLRQPTAQEVQTLARSDKRYWKTSGGRETDSGLANGVLELFGRRKGMGMAG